MIASAKTRRVSSLLVRCVCVTSSLVALAAGLAGLGTACLVIEAADPGAAPCPERLVLTAFGVAGALFLASFALLLQLWRRRGRIGRQVRLSQLRCPGGADGGAGEEEGSEVRKGLANGDEGPRKAAEVGKAPVTPEADVQVDHFAMTQKSSDVSHWIEQQKSADSGTESFPLENEDGATRLASEDAASCCSDREITAL